MSPTGVYRCCDDRRRTLVADHPTLNGIDFLEVTGNQLVLDVHFLKPPPALTEVNVRIEGGERVRNIAITNADVVNGVLIVDVASPGDFSTYTLRIVDPPDEPPDWLDVRLNSIEFSFKVECPSDLDCRTPAVCPPEMVEPPRIDYLARDYTSFRRLMLDRLSLLLPGWGERTAADFGVTMVELLAYVADRLSYRQDAIATEAYLRTARSRTSVRRHARLVDYVMHDGCNARAFVHVRVLGAVKLAEGTQLLTRVPGMPQRFAKTDREYAEALRKGPVVFETMHEADLDPAVNVMPIYTWQSKNCCLPRGATSATLLGTRPLKKGDLVLLGEQFGPQTGNPADADKMHRHVVRVTGVKHVTDALPNPPVDLTEISWDAADALPFPLCVSATVKDETGVPQPIQVGLALGNIVLADHGMTYEETLGVVPEPTLFRPPETEGELCQQSAAVAILPRIRPRLDAGPLTQVARIAPASADAPEPPAFSPTAPASDAMRWSMAEVLPRITVFSDDNDAPEWDVRHDLLESGAADAHFVADVEDNGIATLRFGDDEYGLRPKANSTLKARYRVGNGSAGNVGVESIRHIVTGNALVDCAFNPTPARGGVDPETLEHARQSAPEAFRVQERAVTEADYAEVTERHPDVSRAAATYRWTGSWYTVFDTIDRVGGGEVDAPFEERMREHVNRYRVVGVDLEIDAPRLVSLEIVLTICVEDGYFRADVYAALREVFTSGVRRDGTRGYFHPDHFTFGQPVVLSAIVAAAAAVDGVDAVFVERFRRQGSPATDAINTGVLKLTRLEIAQLANDRNFPDRGVLTLKMRGGM